MTEQRKPPRLPDPDMEGVLPALARAARRAREIARQTDTAIVVVRDGKIVHVKPWLEESESESEE